MASLRDIKRRIKSVKNTQQITKAMKMVSAAKLRRAQEDITAARPYAEKMIELINSLVAKAADSSHPLLSGGGGPKAGVILVTSDRGLCGSFNAALLRKLERFARENRDKELSLYLVGKRAMEFFKRREMKKINQRPMGNARPTYSQAAETARELIDLYLKQELDEVYVIYSEFRSALSQTPVIRRLLPLGEESGEEKEAKTEGAAEAAAEIIYEPSAEEVLSSLLPRFVEVQVFRALLESSASEHGARMTAMDSASKNASEMIGALTLTYNRLRQAAITKELMEIISGAESLKG